MHGTTVEKKRSLNVSSFTCSYFVDRIVRVLVYSEHRICYNNAIPWDGLPSTGSSRRPLKPAVHRGWVSVTNHITAVADGWHGPHWLSASQQAVASLIY